MAKTSKIAKAPKSFKSYALNKCLIGYGVVNGIINAAIFAGINAGAPDAMFGMHDIVHDLAFTGLLLGMLLFACVVPLTRMDLRKGVFSLPGADFHNERIVVAPCGLHERAVERDAFAHVQQVAGRNIQQICVGIVVPGALQAIVQTSGAAYEGEHLVQGVRRCLGVVCGHRGDGIDCCGFGIGHIFLGFSLCAAPLFIH